MILPSDALSQDHVKGICLDLMKSIGKSTLAWLLIFLTAIESINVKLCTFFIN